MPWWFWVFTPIVGFIACGVFHAYVILRSNYSDGRYGGSKNWFIPDWDKVDSDDAFLAAGIGFLSALVWPLSVWVFITIVILRRLTSTKPKQTIVGDDSWVKV